MLMYQKSMFDRCYCIKHFFSLEIVGEMDSKFLFICTYSPLPANVLNMPLPGQRLTSSLLCTLLMMMSVFVKAPDCLFRKTAKH